MAGDRASNKLDHLPAETLDRLIRPFIKFSRIEAASGAVLLLFSLLALALVNSPWSVVFIKIWDTRISVHVGSLELARSARGWIDDGLMTLFFFVGALELKRELILGELRHFRIAALSVAGALGGMLLPACIYLLLRFGQPGANGWGTVMSTDTAFIMGCLALLGSRIPPNLRLFVLSLAAQLDSLGAQRNRLDRRARHVTPWNSKHSNLFRSRWINLAGGRCFRCTRHAYGGSAWIAHADSTMG